jgi:hypothetical protein
LERSDNVADRDHAFAVLKRGYPRRKVILQKVKYVRLSRHPSAFPIVGRDLASRPQWAFQIPPTDLVTEATECDQEFTEENFGI